jgi:hypothetical protein
MMFIASDFRPMPSTRFRDETTTACSFEQCCPDVPLSLGLVAGHRKSLVEPREGEDGDVLAKTAIDSSECCTGRGSV